MTKKESFLFLKRKIGEVTEIEIDGKVAEVIVKEINGKVCSLAFRASRDFKITRKGMDKGIVEATIEKRENKHLQFALKTKSNLGSLNGSPHREGTLSFGEYRNRSLKGIPAYYVDYQIENGNIPEEDKQLLEAEKRRRREAHNIKENL